MHHLPVYTGGRRGRQVKSSHACLPVCAIWFVVQIPKRLLCYCLCFFLSSSVPLPALCNCFFFFVSLYFVFVAFSVALSFTVPLFFCLPFYQYHALLSPFLTLAAALCILSHCLSFCHHFCLVLLSFFILIFCSCVSACLFFCLFFIPASVSFSLSSLLLATWFFHCQLGFLFAVETYTLGFVSVLQAPPLYAPLSSAVCGSVAPH